MGNILRSLPIIGALFGWAGNLFGRSSSGIPAAPRREKFGNAAPKIRPDHRSIKKSRPFGKPKSLPRVGRSIIGHQRKTKSPPLGCNVWKEIS